MPDLLAIIALGSNLGDPPFNVRQAIERLRVVSERPLLESSLWTSTPIDCPPGSSLFVNAVVSLTARSEETPESLLRKLQALEKEFGRPKQRTRNAPRVLDLDLIAFGNQTRATRELILPHPRAHERRFVLQPLSEIAPDLILPGQSRTVRELLALLPQDPLMRRVS